MSRLVYSAQLCHGKLRDGNGNFVLVSVKIVKTEDFNVHYVFPKIEQPCTGTGLWRLWMGAAKSKQIDMEFDPIQRNPSLVFLRKFNDKSHPSMP